MLLAPGVVPALPAGGRVHLSPSPSICLTDSFVSLCLPLFGPGCLPAWTPVTAFWRGSFVSLCLPSFVSVVSQPGCLARLSGCHPLSPFICLPLPQPGCLARLSRWTGSFVSLCLPSFVWHDKALHLSPVVSQPGCLALPLSPICLPLSPSLDAWHSSLGGQFHLSPFVSLHLAPLVSQPGCLSRLSRRTDSLVSLHFVSHLCGCFVSLYLSPVVSQPGCRVDGFICLPLSPFVCLPLSPSLDAPLGGRIDLSPVVSQPGCVALTLRGFLHFPRFCPFGGVWFAFGFGPGFGHSLSCGCWGQGPLSALHLDFDFAWARGGSSSLSIVGYTLSVRSVPRYQLRPLSVLARIWSPKLTRAVRCGARLQLREGSVNPPVKQT